MTPEEETPVHGETYIWKKHYEAISGLIGKNLSHLLNPDSSILYEVGLGRFGDYEEDFLEQGIFRVLRDHGHNLKKAYLIDQNEIAVHIAQENKERLEETLKNKVVIQQANAFDPGVPQERPHIIIANMVIQHFKDRSARESLLKKLLKTLEVDGHIIIDDESVKSTGIDLEDHGFRKIDSYFDKISLYKKEREMP